MTETFIAEKRVTINAPIDAVWQALIDPTLVKQYMHGTNMQTTWEVGSPITWKGEWQGKTYEDKGTVLAVEPNKLLTIYSLEPDGGQRGQARELPHRHVRTCRARGRDRAHPQAGQQCQPGRGGRDGGEQLGPGSRGTQSGGREGTLSSAGATWHD